MPPGGRKKTKVECYISVVVDQHHEALFQSLQKTNSFLSAAQHQALLAVGAGVQSAGNSQQSLAAASGLNDSQRSNASTTLSDGGRGAAAGMYLVKEDTGFDRCCVVVAGTQRPYLGKAPAGNRQHQPTSQQVCVVVAILSVQEARELFKIGALADYLADGLARVAANYTSFSTAKTAAAGNTSKTKSSNNSIFADDEDDDEDRGEDTDGGGDDGDGSSSDGGGGGGKPAASAALNLYPKLFLLIEAKQHTQSEFGMLADLAVLQSRATAVAHVAMTNHGTSPTTTDTTHYMQALANYFSRKCGGSEGPVAQTRGRDDTLCILEPNFLGKASGKIDCVNYLDAYKAFLCEIDGVTRQGAINIVSRFPTLRALLRAIDSKDQRALAVLAQTKNEGGRAMGAGIVQRIIDRLSTPFDEQRVLHSTARAFFEAKAYDEERQARTQQ